MTIRTTGAVYALALLTLAIPLLAHHSTGANFDVSTTVTVEGVITKVMLANPHSVMYLDAKNSKGGSEAWILYGNPPSALTRLGYTSATFKEGLRVTAVGNPARDATSLSISGHVLESPANGKTVHVVEVGEIRIAGEQVIPFGRGPAFNGGTTGQRQY